jgi:Ion transport protein
VQLDVLIVATSLVLIAAESANLNAIKALRVLRAVKPLRMLSHSAGMLVVLKAVALSVAALANVSVLLILTFTMFGAMGMQLFSGRLYRYVCCIYRA